MDLDLMFVLGFVVSIFAIPAIVSAFSDGRTPRLAVFVILIGAGMIYYPNSERPGAYTFETIPDVFLRVVGRYIG